jgi:hypothetical protein
MRGQLLTVGALLTIIGSISACGDSNDAAADRTTTVTVSNGETVSTQTPSSSPTSTGAMTEGVLPKAIGEPAGVGCPDDPAEPCDLNFTVTSVQANAPCPDPYGNAPLDPGEQYIRFEVDASASDRMPPDLGRVLHISNWAIENDEGVLNRSLEFASPCTKLTDAVAEEFVPGTRMKSDVTVIAPGPAKELRLIVGGLSWTWPIS